MNPIRLLLLTVIASLAVACDDCEGDLSFGSESSESSPTEQQGSRFVEGSRPSAEGMRRGWWELRLWVGLWCDRSGSAGPVPVDGLFVFEIDGVEMHRAPGTCADPTEPPRSVPNATSFSFTLAEGRHLIRITSPDGVASVHPFELGDDSWMVVRHEPDEESGAMRTVIAVTHHPLPADNDYDPRTRPGARDDMEWPRGREPGSQRGAGRPHAIGGAGPENGQVGGPGAGGRDGRGGEAAVPEDEWTDGSIGYLDIRSVIPARVWVDGRSTGAETPVWGMRLEHGNHRIVLRDEARGFERAFSVDVVGGVTRTLINDETD